MRNLHLARTPRFWVLDFGSNNNNRDAKEVQVVLPKESSLQNYYYFHPSQPSPPKVGKILPMLITEPSNNDDDGKGDDLPMMDLTSLLLHQQLGLTDTIQAELLTALQNHGYVFLKVASQTTTTTTARKSPGKIVEAMKDALETQLFPNDTALHKDTLETSDVIYLNERGVPMWKLGYEQSEDGIREFFRVHAGCVDDQPWPKSRITGTNTASTNTTAPAEFRQTWLRGLGLCRDVCDVALELCCTTNYGDGSDHKRILQQPQKRPSSGRATWHADKYSSIPVGQIPERSGDYSVLYAMHYFNNNETSPHHLGKEDESGFNINVKQHVDPSLFVLEPFLCQQAEGLQVYDPSFQKWIDCDGPNSPVHGQPVMCLFVGKAFAKHCPSVQPTLHRVVASTHSRRSIIYEQKYEEYWDC